ncbi:MAG: glycerol-3-phosphate dehydrogenase/oxidase [Vicinamibacterales bacterium]
MGRLAGLQGAHFDVAVIGGGIIGCGIARDAALRGLRVALFEKRDFGSGTTSASTRIVHGGLRYLEMLDFRLVRMDLRERETLLRIAPHLVRPLEFLIPFFKGDGVSSLKLRAGLALYDALSYDKQLPSRRWLTAADARAADRILQRTDLRGAAAYHDARVDSPERLALENVIDAQRHEARPINYSEVIAARPPAGGVAGIRVRDNLDGAEADVSARVIVNATGAWFEPVTERLVARRTDVVRTTKGIHIVVPPLTSRALVLYSHVDRRLLFAIPRCGLTWIGTTDTDFDGDPADARATRQDVEYLLASVRGLLPSLRMADVLFTTAGVRALVRQRGSESSVSRMHRIVDGEPLGPAGMISVLGGKITGYRAIAEEVIDAVCKRLGVVNRGSMTAQTRLPGAPRNPEADRLAVRPHLYDLYGGRAADVVAVAQSTPGLEQPLSPKYPDIAAQVVFSVRQEHCVRLSDFLRRRTLLGASDDQGWEAAAPVAALMAGELGWSSARVAEEIEEYRHDVAATLAFKDDS